MVEWGVRDRFRIAAQTFALGCLVLLVLFTVYRHQSVKPPVDEQTVLEEIAPGILFGPKGGSPLHLEGRDGSVAFNSYDVTPEIRGYAGPIKVLVRLDRDGNISGLKILSHRETRNYVHRLETPEFLRQFIGKSVRDPFVLDEDLDGISRATVTVQAVGDTLRESGRRVARDALGLAMPGPGGSRQRLAAVAAYGTLFLAAVVLFLLTKRNVRLLRFRDVSLLASLIVVGLWVSSPFSILHGLNVIMSGLPNYPLWYVAVAGVFLTFLLWGRVYCGWICPFGALAEFLNRLPVRKWHVDLEFENRWRNVKYLFFGLAVLSAAYSDSAGAAGFETYVTLFSRNGSWIAWSLVGFVLVTELRVKRFWCRYLCPVGAMGGLLSRNEPGYPSRNDCPMANPRIPPGSECIRCNRCRHSPSGDTLSEVIPDV